RTVNGAGWCTLPSTVQTLLQFFHRYWHFQRCSSTVPRPAKKIHTWHSRLLPCTPYSTKRLPHICFVYDIRPCTPPYSGLPVGINSSPVPPCYLMSHISIPLEPYIHPQT